MLILAISNLTNRKIRSILSILAVAIAITLLLVLVGLSHGTLNEVAQRMASVEAEIVVRDRHFDLGSMSGGKLWEKEIARIAELQIASAAAVQHVIPVFLGRIKLGGLTQNVFGVYPGDFDCFAGSRRLLSGSVFADVNSPAEALAYFTKDANPTDNSHNYLPLIIDQRLCRASRLRVGDTIEFGDTPARIVGIIETGVAGRVFAPINILRRANGISAPTAHLFFVKADPRLSTDQLHQLCQKIQQTTHRSASLVANYGQVLAENFRNLTIFISMVSAIALVICFLFILVTVHTSVLERGREIAILQSLGAGRTVILGQIIQESLLICSLGTVIGIILTYGSRWLIESFQPLMTIEIRPAWLLIAVGIGLGGGIIRALYPGFMALSRDTSRSP